MGAEAFLRSLVALGLRTVQIDTEEDLQLWFNYCMIRGYKVPRQKLFPGDFPRYFVMKDTGEYRKTVETQKPPISEWIVNWKNLI